jgi:uridylate kinase
MSRDSVKYKRVVLKLSGEGLVRPGGFGIDEEALASTADELAPIARRGVQLAIVIGGGNFFRARQIQDHSRITRMTADTMGMLATSMNALALRDCLEADGLQVRVMGTVTRPEVCEPYILRKAIDHLDHQRVVILAGGTGSPYFTTDTCAALRAAELGAQAVLKATKVDGVFSDDPQKNPKARKFDTLTYEEVLARKLGVMDLTAVSLCMESRIPVIVYRFAQPGNTLRAVTGKAVGTLITA